MTYLFYLLAAAAIGAEVAFGGWPLAVIAIVSVFAALVADGLRLNAQTDREKLESDAERDARRVDADADRYRRSHELELARHRDSMEIANLQLKLKQEREARIAAAAKTAKPVDSDRLDRLAIDMTALEDTVEKLKLAVNFRQVTAQPPK